MNAEPRAPWYADPNCHQCPGDGWISDRGYLTECTCRQPEPYTATIHPIRKETPA